MGIGHRKRKAFDVQVETGQILPCNSDRVNHFMVVCENPQIFRIDPL